MDDLYVNLVTGTAFTLLGAFLGSIVAPVSDLISKILFEKVCNRSFDRPRGLLAALVCLFGANAIWIISELLVSMFQFAGYLRERVLTR